jgi:2-polyprenyl-3-methyl-5-hydroxy-6-metoxy-1,4-benzoquinol methylase
MEAIVKFSKPSGNIVKLKENFFSENEELLNNSIKINDAYAKQNLRKKCKNCDNEISGEDFSSFHVGYKICSKCTHLNGIYEDSNEFVTRLYADSSGDNYKSNYLNNYDGRVENIYLPKVKFLVDVLSKISNEKNTTILDVGCGGGHFVKACEIESITAKGVDPSSSLIDLGKTKLNKNNIELCNITDFEKVISDSSSTVVSMIGVLEHLQKPRKALEAFTKSNSKYLYISVPLFSFSSFIEHSFKDVFPRQLSAGHTHLYTKESLDYLASEFKLKVVGEWWFGTDFVDLFRSLKITSQNKSGDAFSKSFEHFFANHIDELQSVLDRKKLSSEVHMIFSR